MKTLTYPLMNQSQWHNLVDKLNEKFSLNIKTAQGRSSQWGFTFAWCYDTTAQSLDLQCLQKPLWLPDDLLETKIAELVNKALAHKPSISKISPEGITP